MRNSMKPPVRCYQKHSEKPGLLQIQINSSNIRLGEFTGPEFDIAFAAAMRKASNFDSSSLLPSPGQLGVLS